MKDFFKIIITIGLCLIFVFILLNFSPRPQLTITKQTLEFQTLEVVKTKEDQEKGLMGREELCYKCGMVFDFKDGKYPSFWMKDTYINLAIIFLDKDNIVDAVYTDTKVNSSTMYNPSGERLIFRVLEIPSQRARDLNITKGQKLELKLE
jgi:uncharacterized membrane protein (UPF0127 family)